MHDFWVLLITVSVFSIVQSLFGVGLLVFGTPTLLLVGYPFEETIALLLPCSILISLLQAWQGKQYVTDLCVSLPLYSVPFIVLGLALVLSNMLVMDIKALVGTALVFSAITRFTPFAHDLLARLLRRCTTLYLMGMGFIHGLSNMGGGFLTIFVTTLYSDKESTRANIAYGYFIFALSQIAVLLFLRPDVFNMNCLVLATMSLAIYLSIGSYIFIRSSRRVYQRLITAFMVGYGVVLIGQRLLP